jgi:hypothetical protein
MAEEVSETVDRERFALRGRLFAVRKSSRIVTFLISSQGTRWLASFLLVDSTSGKAQPVRL